MTNSLRVAVIGGSGTGAIRELVSRLPERSGIAFLIAIPDQAELGALLRPVSKLAVIDAAEAVQLEPDRIYVVPAGRDVTLRRSALQVSSPTTPVAQLDRLLRSVAEEIGRASTAVILEGTGTDGAIGLKRIKEAGGVALAQVASDGELGEMPRAAIATGLVDLVVEIGDLAQRMCTLTAAPEDPLDDEPAHVSEPAIDSLQDILALVRARSGHDFSAYKRATLYRRVARRVHVCQCASTAAYCLYLRDHPTELAHLLRDFLISVTNFFRDPDAYRVLATDVLPQLFAGKTAADQIRVWVAGCATGE
ncbi:MAG: chemotaxis protein CheB, partial [Polyangiales bacterium]